MTRKVFASLFVMAALLLVPARVGGLLMANTARPQVVFSCGTLACMDGYMSYTRVRSDLESQLGSASSRSAHPFNPQVKLGSCYFVPYYLAGDKTQTPYVVKGESVACYITWLGSYTKALSFNSGVLTIHVSWDMFGPDDADHITLMTYTFGFTPGVHQQ